MKKILLISIVLLVISNLATAQKNLAINTKQEGEKTIPAKTPSPTQAIMWKENGTGTNDIYITFSKEFTKALNGKQPIVLITPISNNQGFYISEISDKGFMVKKGDSIETKKELRFNWQAEIPNIPQNAK